MYMQMVYATSVLNILWLTGRYYIRFTPSPPDPLDPHLQPSYVVRNLSLEERAVRWIYHFRGYYCWSNSTVFTACTLNGRYERRQCLTISFMLNWSSPPVNVDFDYFSRHSRGYVHGTPDSRDFHLRYFGQTWYGILVCRRLGRGIEHYE